MSVPLTSGDPLADEWAARVYRLLRENNGVVQRCLDRREEDFTVLPGSVQDEIRELTQELFSDLMAPPLKAVS